MTLTSSEQKNLLQLIETGVDRSAERLAKLSRTPWSLHTVSLSILGEDKNLEKSLSEDSKDSYFGAYFTMPDGAFLTLFSRKSGKALTNSFVGSYAGRLDKLADLEQFALGELSNIIVNAVSDVLADSCASSFFISVPELLRDNKPNLISYALNKFNSSQKAFTLMSYVHLSSSSLSSDCTLVIILTPRLIEKLKSNGL